MPSAAITLTASNLLWGHHLSYRPDRPTCRLQLGLQLGDPPFRRSQLGLLTAGQTRLQAAIRSPSLLVAEPVDDPQLGDPHHPGLPHVIRLPQEVLPVSRHMHKNVSWTISSASCLLP